MIHQIPYIYKIHTYQGFPIWARRNWQPCEDDLLYKFLFIDVCEKAAEKSRIVVWPTVIVFQQHLIYS